MQRFTISLDDKLAEAFDAWIAGHGHANRSEAVRDLLRAALERSSQKAGQGEECVANLSYLTQRNEFDVTRRLAALHHDNHDLLVSSLQVPLDHDCRLETLVLKGKVEAVRTFAQQLCALRGVRHGKLNLVSVEWHESHRHASALRAGGSKRDAPPPHLHLRPAH